MALPRYLAMTREEIAACSPLPKQLAWMACHFSPYGTGLVNLPTALPAGSMVILNDRIQMAGHNPDTVINQLQVLDPDCLLLDFQCEPTAPTMDLTRCIAKALSCPVGVSAAYGKELDCPLFLPVPPPDTPLAEYFAPWRGREIWLEIILNAIRYTVTGTGAIPSPLSSLPEIGQHDPDLCCHYHITKEPDKITFDLWRTRQDITDLLKNASTCGITKTVGLWQELE